VAAARQAGQPRGEKAGNGPGPDLRGNGMEFRLIAEAVEKLGIAGGF